MRVNKPITGKEQKFSADERLISTTDLKGVITHANTAFCRVSGYSEEELRGKAHNIIRHPDMPEVVYQDFWDTLKSDKAWMGIVKNRCKNGDHYWVNAYVSPVFDNGEKVGYQSVRTCPQRDHVERAEKVYERLRRSRSAVRLIDRISLHTMLTVSGLLLPLMGYAAAALSVRQAAVMGIVALLTVAGGAAGTLLAKRLQRFDKRLRSVFDNQVARQVYGGGQDTIAQAELAHTMQSARLDALHTRIDEFSVNLASAARDTQNAVSTSTQAIDKQQQEMDQVATAMNEMSATVQEVSSNTTEASQTAQEASNEAASGRQVILEATNAMQQLATEVEQVAGIIEHLKGDTDAIRHILDVIHGIADQTNLLALNAAIEAARAGESGRGFAVVADEVRALAQRVSKSTDEITSMIERLESGAGNAVTAMTHSQQSVHWVQGNADQAAEAISNIEQAIQRISTMNDQIASATEEQSSTSEEINRNIIHIKDGVEETAEVANRTQATSEQLITMVEELHGLLKQFRQGY